VLTSSTAFLAGCFLWCHLRDSKRQLCEARGCVHSEWMHFERCLRRLLSPSMAMVRPVSSSSAEIIYNESALFTSINYACLRQKNIQDDCTITQTYFFFLLYIHLPNDNCSFINITLQKTYEFHFPSCKRTLWHRAFLSCMNKPPTKMASQSLLIWF
jgi:hypothetical protein